MDPELIYLPFYYVRIKVTAETIHIFSVNALSCEVKKV